MLCVVIKMCTQCGDVVRHLTWRQLALDESHAVRFTACECQCGYKLLAAVVVETVKVDNA